MDENNASMYGQHSEKRKGLSCSGFDSHWFVQHTFSSLDVHRPPNEQPFGSLLSNLSFCQDWRFKRNQVKEPGTRSWRRVPGVNEGGN